MGLCGSSNAAQTPAEQAKRKEEHESNAHIQSMLNKSSTQDKQLNKLLLLGAGESGKSTLFKQMITIYGKGFDVKERETYRPIIHNNIIVSIKTLARECHERGPVAANNQQALAFVEKELKVDASISVEIGNIIAQLWADAGIQKTYSQRASYQLTDSAAYFFDRVKEVSLPDYLPTQQDVLRSRVRTTGIVENDFVIEGNKFKMFDVGGQRNERKKWIHCFENVTAVMFVAAISEYDQMLYEDESTNRVVEALDLFEEICNLKWFQKTSIILFLNKRDLFAEKIKTSPLNKWFPAYTGSNSYDSACQFMKEQFESKNHQDKSIYTHLCCATDTTNVQAVFNAVKDIIIRKSLEEVGM